MIVASPKSIQEIVRIIERHEKVLFVGCGTCVTVCLAGGEREVGITAYAVRMARKLAQKPVQIEQATIERQCENEFIKDLAPLVERNEAVVSFGCGAGVQALAERFPNKPVYAALKARREACDAMVCIMSAGEVVRLTDGPLALLPCASRNFYKRCDDCACPPSAPVRQIQGSS